MRKGVRFMQRQNIDSGNAFDWGKTSQDYGKFRDIYPPLFYQKIVERNCGTAGQEVLDIGTGTIQSALNLYESDSISDLIFSANSLGNTSFLVFLR